MKRPATAPTTRPSSTRHTLRRRFRCRTPVDLLQQRCAHRDAPPAGLRARTRCSSRARRSLASWPLPHRGQDVVDAHAVGPAASTRPSCARRGDRCGSTAARAGPVGHGLGQRIDDRAGCRRAAPARRRTAGPRPSPPPPRGRRGLSGGFAVRAHVDDGGEVVVGRAHGGRLQLLRDRDAGREDMRRQRTLALPLGHAESARDADRADRRRQQEDRERMGPFHSANLVSISCRNAAHKASKSSALSATRSPMSIRSTALAGS